jgi:hypothetical protein
MGDDLDKATFAASIPPIMSGLKMGGDGCRIQFDVPESDIGEAVKLVAMRGKRLKVTVEIVTEKYNGMADKETEGPGGSVGNRRALVRRDKRKS